jgi:hypothetical protein
MNGKDHRAAPSDHPFQTAPLRRFGASICYVAICGGVSAVKQERHFGKIRSVHSADLFVDCLLAISVNTPNQMTTNDTSSAGRLPMIPHSAISPISRIEPAPNKT